MVTFEEFRQWALSFDDTQELPHFDIPSFRWKGKIFATWHPKENKAMLKLDPVLQSVYVSYNSAVFVAVPGAWGAKGATFVLLDKARKDVFREALIAAYEGVAKPKNAGKRRV